MRSASGPSGDEEEEGLPLADGGKAAAAQRVGADGASSIDETVRPDASAVGRGRLPLARRRHRPKNAAMILVFGGYTAAGATKRYYRQRKKPWRD